MMGRVATTLTEHQKSEVETLAAVLTAEQLADYFEIGRTTFFAMMQREPEIAARYKKGKARAIGSIAQSLITKARAGDTTSMIFFLKTQGGWRETMKSSNSMTLYTRRSISPHLATRSSQRSLPVRARPGRPWANARPAQHPIGLSVARPRHEPDAFSRRQVETLAGCGIPEAEIAGLVYIDPKTLRRHYRQELDHGHTKVNAKVAESLFRKATGEGSQSVTAAIFWLKTRAHWKEISVLEHGGVAGRPIEQVQRIERIIITAPDMDKLQRERENWRKSFPRCRLDPAPASDRPVLSARRVPSLPVSRRGEWRGSGGE